jgi:hypothetical protein
MRMCCKCRAVAATDHGIMRRDRYDMRRAVCIAPKTRCACIAKVPCTRGEPQACELTPTCELTPRSANVPTGLQSLDCS